MVERNEAESLAAQRRWVSEEMGIRRDQYLGNERLQAIRYAG